MAFQVLTTTAASITELKRDPMGTFRAGDGAPVAIPKRMFMGQHKMQNAGTDQRMNIPFMAV